MIQRRAQMYTNAAGVKSVTPRENAENGEAYLHQAYCVHVKAQCIPCAVNDRWCYISLLLGGVRQHVETLHGIVPGLFIVRVAPFRQPLSTCHQQLCRHRDIVTANQSIESYLLLISRRAR